MLPEIDTKSTAESRRFAAKANASMHGSRGPIAASTNNCAAWSAGLRVVLFVAIMVLTAGAAPMPSEPVDRLLAALATASGHAPSRNGSSWSARCPAHDDKSPSLSVSQSDDGRALVHCHAGCTAKDVATALGLRMADLMPSRNGRADAPRKKPQAFATADAAIEVYERKFGKPDRVGKFYDDHDELVGFELRWNKTHDRPKKENRPVSLWPDGWRCAAMPAPRPLYRLRDVAAADAVYIQEGPPKVDLMADLGFTATTSAGGSKAGHKSDWSPLAGKTVYLMPDHDDAGEKYAAAVCKILTKLTPAPTVSILRLPDLDEGGDVVDYADAQRKAGRTDVEIGEAIERLADSAEPVDLAEADKNGDAYTELEFATKLIDQHADRLRFCNAFKWLHYNGQHWERDQLDRAIELTKRLVKGRSSFEKNGKVKGIIALAESDPRIRVMADRFDAHPMLLNVANGTLDLETGKLHPHKPTDPITKLAPVTYDPRETCPRFAKFMQEIFDGDDELVGFVQRAIGYSLCGDTREQCLFLLHGRGANGKSVLVTTVQAILGTYGTSADASTFMVQRPGGARPDIARLAGARLVCSVETEESQHIAESLVKQLTGGDVVVARYLYHNDFEFKPAFKLFLAANHKPRIGGQDFAIWRRIHLIPFGVRFEGDRADKDLPAKLVAESSGILNWMLSGFADWQEVGLQPPEAVTQATREYRSEEDVLSEFLDARCVIDNTREVKFSELYKAYHDWTEHAGDKQISRKLFSQRLADRGIDERRTGRDRWRVGIGLAGVG